MEIKCLRSFARGVVAVARAKTRAMGDDVGSGCNRADEDADVENEARD